MIIQPPHTSLAHAYIYKLSSISSRHISYFLERTKFPSHNYRYYSFRFPWHLSFIDVNCHLSLVHTCPKFTLARLKRKRLSLIIMRVLWISRPTKSTSLPEILFPFTGNMAFGITTALINSKSYSF